MGETEVEGFLCDFQRTREHSAEELTGILPNKTIKVTDTWQSHVAMHFVK
jgi:hypothetical protein